MQIPTNKHREEVVKSIRACIIANQEDVTIQMLSNDYEELNGEPIPFREFNCPSLLVFLHQLHNSISIENKFGRTVVRALNDDKSTHISELVKNQRPHKPSNRKFQKPFQGFPARRSRVTLDSSVLMALVQHIKNNDDVTFENAMEFVNQHCTPLEITRDELENQLRSIAHLVRNNGNRLYSTEQASTSQPHFRNSTSNEVCKPIQRNFSQNPRFKPRPLMETAQKPISQNRFNRPFQESNKSNENKTFFSPRFAQLKKFDNKGHQSQNNGSYKNRDSEANKECSRSDNSSNSASNQRNENLKDENLQDKKLSGLKGEEEEMTKIQLLRLIHFYPNGIWCEDVPELYQTQYKTPLVYSKSKFKSLLEFVSHLPNIFYCVKPMDAEEYKLFNAKKPLPSLTNEPGSSSLSSYSSNLLGYDSIDMSLNLEVMELGEFVTHSSVTDFGKDVRYEVVEISQVISPSLFYIQLCENAPKFKRFVDSLIVFYETQKSRYKVPVESLKRGLNVVCFFDNKWSRGIIKEVFPDNQATIFFYDFGIEKNFLSEDIFFLHRSFSHMPIQTIPCGLYNMKPYQTLNWTREVIWEFVTKTSITLVATVVETDLDENFLFVDLTDTRGNDDFHISDWMCEEQLGEYGQISSKFRNFTFRHYKECLQRKGFDPSAVHYLPCEDKKIVKKIEKREDTQERQREEIKETVFRGISHEKKSELPPRLLRLMNFIGIEQSKHEEEEIYEEKREEREEKVEEEQEVLEDELPPLKEVAGPPRKSNSTEIIENRKFLKLLSFLKEKEESSHCNGVAESSGNKSTSTVDTSDISSSDSSPKISPFKLKESTDESEDLPYFGTFASECGGRGRMEPMDWSKVRLPSTNQNKARAQENKVSQEKVERVDQAQAALPPKILRLLELQSKMKK